MLLRTLTNDSLELARRAGNEPQIVGLIRVYKDYYPDVIVGDATRGRASVFTVLDNTE
jgi:centromere protein I